MAKRKVSLEKVLVNLKKILGDTKVKKVPKAPNKIVVKPKTNDDVSRIIRLAVKEGVPIIPKRELQQNVDETQAQERVIMDTSEMNGIFKIDVENLAITVGPGVLWKDLHEILSQKEYSIGAYPVSSTPSVGGWVDTGGAGIGSYNHGFATDLVRSMEVVLPNGKIINTGFEKVLSNSSGYNLNGLFVGADSTLGIITKITLKMFPIPQETRPLYYTFLEPKSMTEAMHEVTRLKTTPFNISFFGKNHIQYLKMLGKNVPSIDGMAINVTLAGIKSVVEHDEKVIDGVMGKHGAKKESNSTAKILWKERFFEVPSDRAEVALLFSEALIPLSNLLPMINDIYTLIDKMKINATIIGILCDRSTVELTPYLLIDRKSKGTSVFSKKLGELALKHRGRPIGSSMFLKSDLKQVYGEGLNTILDIKSAIDPHNIMNPDRLS